MEESTSKAYLGKGGSPHPITGNGNGSALFVINLCASIAPVPTTGKNIPGLDNYRLYQVARVEDGRTRHRLRLGFFTSESHAESVLTVVRQQYPTAFTTCLCDEDRRFARGYLPDSAFVAATPAPQKPAAAPSRPAPATPPTTQNIAKPAPAAPTKPAVAPTREVAATKAPAAPAREPAAAKSVAPAAAKASAVNPVAQKATSSESEVFEMTWEPETPPKQPVLTDDAGLDEFEWEDEPVSRGMPSGLRFPSGANPPVARAAVAAKVQPSASTSATGKHKIVPPPATKIDLSAKAPAAPQSKLPPKAPAAKADASTSMRVPALKPKADASTSMRVPALKPQADTSTSMRVPALKPKADTATSMRVPALKPKADSSTSMRVPALKEKVDTATSQRVPALKPKADPSTSMRVPALTLSDPAPVTPSKQNGAPGAPFHVGRGVEIDDFDISFQDEPAVAKPAAPAVKPAAAAPAAKKPAAATPPAAKKKVEAPAKAAAPAATKQQPAPAKPAAAAPARPAAQAHPDLDSTQTIRALTSEELNDAAQDKWFAIQLAASEQPVNLDTMPHLDIFEAYRLYSVASAGSGKIVHSLRLGFFKEAVSAEAVSGYLKTFFSTPSVLRVSVAEHARFKDAPAPKKPPEEPRNNVVELSNARAGRAVVPTVTNEVAGGPGVDPSATGSFRTGTYKNGAIAAKAAGTSGTYKALSATGTHKALGAVAAAKSAGLATKRAEPPRPRTGNTGKHKALNNKKSLADELMDEARELELEESGVRKVPQNGSLLSRLVDKLTK